MALKEIYIDEEQSWFPEIRDLFDEHLDILRAYEQERARIDAMAENDIDIRINRPPNEHQAIHDMVLKRCNDALAGANLVGYHCARLHRDDIESIGSNGLVPLSVDFFNRRIDQREASGDFPPHVANRLRQENQIKDQNRLGRLSLIFSRCLLKDEYGVIRLFRSWGGESLYNTHEDDADTGSYLRKIGVPCIAVVLVPVAAIQTYCTVGERFLSVFLSRRGVATEIDPEMEGQVKITIGSDSVQRIIERHKSEFVTLTECDTWRSEI